MFNFLAASTLFGLYSRRGKVKASTSVASYLSATKTSAFLSSSLLAKSNLSRSGPQLHQGSHGVSLLQAGQALGRIEEKSTRLCWHKSIFDAFCGRAKATICLTSIPACFSFGAIGLSEDCESGSKSCFVMITFFRTDIVLVGGS